MSSIRDLKLFIERWSYDAPLDGEVSDGEAARVREAHANLATVDPSDAKAIDVDRLVMQAHTDAAANVAAFKRYAAADLLEPVLKLPSASNIAAVSSRRGLFEARELIKASSGWTGLHVGRLAESLVRLSVSDPKKAERVFSDLEAALGDEDDVVAVAGALMRHSSSIAVFPRSRDHLLHLAAATCSVAELVGKLAPFVRVDGQRAGALATSFHFADRQDRRAFVVALVAALDEGSLDQLSASARRALAEVLVGGRYRSYVGRISFDKRDVAGLDRELGDGERAAWVRLMWGDAIGGAGVTLSAEQLASTLAALAKTNPGEASKVLGAMEATLAFDSPIIGAKLVESLTVAELAKLDASVFDLQRHSWGGDRYDPLPIVAELAGSRHSDVERGQFVAKLYAAAPLAGEALMHSLPLNAPSRAGVAQAIIAALTPAQIKTLGAAARSALGTDLDRRFSGLSDEACAAKARLFWPEEFPSLSPLSPPAFGRLLARRQAEAPALVAKILGETDAAFDTPDHRALAAAYLQEKGAKAVLADPSTTPEFLAAALFGLHDTALAVDEEDMGRSLAAYVTMNPVLARETLAFVRAYFNVFPAREIPMLIAMAEALSDEQLARFLDRKTIDDLHWSISQHPGSTAKHVAERLRNVR